MLSEEIKIVILFRRSSDDLEKTKFFKILFERISGRLSSIFVKTINKSEMIEVDHKEALSLEDIEKFFGNERKENENIVVDLENNLIDDLEFKETCIKSVKICKKITIIFQRLDFIFNVFNTVILIILPIAEFYKLSIYSVFIILCVFVPLIWIGYLCQWSKLSEKYARLDYDFNMLSISKEENRINKYIQLATQFKSEWVFSDII
jgi:hypothetical protein